MRATAAIVAGTVLLALIGFGIGRVTAPSSSDAREARESARADATRAAKRVAYDKGQERGLAAGKKKGREDGDAAGERKGLAAGQEAAGNGTAGTTTDQTTGSTGSSGSSGSSGSTGSTGGSTSETPSVDSPEGQEIIQNSPECQDHPPPPDYHGPVQC